MASSESQRAPARAVSGHASSLILFVTVFIDLLGFGIVIPFLPMYAQRLHVGAAAIGVILAAYSFMQLVCAPFLGRLSDRVGRRPIILLGLLGSSLGYLIYGFAFSFAMLLLSRLVHGACAGTVSTAQAWVADTTEGKDRARGMGMIGAAFGLGFVLGPAIGALLGHGSLRTPALFACALTFANLIFALVMLPESHRPAPGARVRADQLLQPLLDLPRRLARDHLTRLFTLAFLETFAMAALEATFAMMVPAVYGWGEAGVGWLLAFAGLVQALAQGYLLGKIVGRIGERRLLRAGLVLLALGLLPMGTIRTHAALFVMLAPVALGYGLASPCVASLISRRTSGARQGEVLGINQSALSLARVLGPIAGGLVYGALAPAAPYIGGAAVTVLALAISFSLPKSPVEVVSYPASELRDSAK